MKIFLTGVTGTLGGAVKGEFGSTYELIAPPEEEFDLTFTESIEERVDDARPDLILHCAALTNVDRCETEPLLAEGINHLATRVLAGCARDLRIPMIYISTDYVFDGERGGYSEDDPTNPINIYGETKLRGEMAVRATLKEHYIIRTSWVFGHGGQGFLSNLVEHAKKGPLKLVTDQTTCPTYAPDLAKVLRAVVEHTPPFGLYHAAGSKGTTPYLFGKRTLEIARVDGTIDPIETGSLTRPARRPRNTVLDCGRLKRILGIELPDWENALERFLKSKGQLR
jgi:dTDP-4-dehydrorhamnose reductase